MFGTIYDVTITLPGLCGGDSCTPQTPSPSTINLTAGPPILPIAAAIIHQDFTITIP